MTPEQHQTLTRWRLILGNFAEQHGISLDAGDKEAVRIEALVGFLFGNDGKLKPGVNARDKSHPGKWSLVIK